jgi:archaellin
MLSRTLSLFLQLLAAARRTGNDERGQTGMEIALIGAVCASCVLGTVVITTSDEASQQLESVLRAGLARASGTLIVTGPVVVTSDGTPATVDEIVLTVGTIGTPGPASLDPTAEGDRLLVAFQNEDVYDSDLPYVATEVIGDHDGYLEAGETAELRIRMSDVGDGSVTLGPLAAWTLQLSAPYGGIVSVSRTMPLALDRVNALH